MKYLTAIIATCILISIVPVLLGAGFSALMDGFWTWPWEWNRLSRFFTGAWGFCDMPNISFNGNY